MYEQIRELLRARPFQPFRIHVNDGRHFNVKHPEFCMVWGQLVVVGVVAKDTDAHHVTHIQLSNITSVDIVADLPTAQAS